MIEPGDALADGLEALLARDRRGDRVQRREGHGALSPRHARRPPIRGGRDRGPPPPPRPRRRDGGQADRRMMELAGAPPRDRRPPGDHGSDPRLLLPLRQQRAGGGRRIVHRRCDRRLRPGVGHDRRLRGNRRDDRRRARADLRGYEPPRLEHPDHVRRARPGRVGRRTSMRGTATSTARPTGSSGVATATASRAPRPAGGSAGSLLQAAGMVDFHRATMHPIGRR